jgi:glyoxylase-like metal-dependent hydrolase (beta-lactamase superfamily II)
MEGMKDHGRYSNLDHAAYAASIRRTRLDPDNLGLPGHDGPRLRRAAEALLTEERRLMGQAA